MAIKNYNITLTSNLFGLNLYLSQYLLVLSQQWKHQNNVCNLLKVNKKETKLMSVRSFWCFS